MKAKCIQIASLALLFSVFGGISRSLGAVNSRNQKKGFVSSKKKNKKKKKQTNKKGEETEKLARKKDADDEFLDACIESREKVSQLNFSGDCKSEIFDFFQHDETYSREKYHKSLVEMKDLLKGNLDFIKLLQKTWKAADLLDHKHEACVKSFGGALICNEGTWIFNSEKLSFKDDEQNSAYFIMTNYVKPLIENELRTVLSGNTIAKLNLLLGSGASNDFRSLVEGTIRLNDSCKTSIGLIEMEKAMKVKMVDFEKNIGPSYRKLLTPAGCIQLIDHLDLFATLLCQLDKNDYRKFANVLERAINTLETAEKKVSIEVKQIAERMKQEKNEDSVCKLFEKKTILKQRSENTVFADEGCNESNLIDGEGKNFSLSEKPEVPVNPENLNVTKITNEKKHTIPFERYSASAWSWRIKSEKAYVNWCKRYECHGKLPSFNEALKMHAFSCVVEQYLPFAEKRTGSNGTIELEFKKVSITDLSSGKSTRGRILFCYNEDSKVCFHRCITLNDTWFQAVNSVKNLETEINNAFTVANVRNKEKNVEVFEDKSGLFVHIIDRRSEFNQVITICLGEPKNLKVKEK